MSPHVEPVRTSRQVLATQSVRLEDGATGLVCPGPGLVSLARGPGEAVVPGSEIGVLVRDEQWFRLVVPTGATGVIRTIHLPDRWNACEHGQELLALRPWRADDENAAADDEQRTGEGIFVHSPTHGTFYRRPAPDAPPFVEPGQTVRRGQTIGLVEVMKCFSPIAFDPPDDLDAARVEEILAEDGVEVRSGQPLLRLARA